MKTLKIEVTYVNDAQRGKFVRKIYLMIAAGINEYQSDDFSYSVQGRKTMADDENAVRFEKVNGEQCVVIQSRINY